MPDIQEDEPVYTLTHDDWKTHVYYAGANADDLYFRIETVYTMQPKIGNIVYEVGNLVHAVNRAIQIHHEEH
jgi:hypothetical protein